MQDLFKDPFIDRFIEEGMQEGIARGVARALLTILSARGLPVEQVRARVTECTDAALLDQWTARAATATTIDEVFAG